MTGNQKSIKEKVARYCALQERSQQQVREKLNTSYDVFGEAAEEIIAELITHDFINEERFARAYVRGKFRMKKWGKNKIMQGLYGHRISDYCTKKGFEEINKEDYHNTMNELLQKYLKTLKEDEPWIAKHKAARYLISKGYEPPIVYELVNAQWE